MEPTWGGWARLGVIFVATGQVSGQCLIEEVLAEPPTGSGFGVDVAIEGGVMLVADTTNTVGGPIAGAARIFERESSGWKEVGLIAPPDPEFFGLFGFPVELSGDAALIGASGTDPAGLAYIFRRSSRDQWLLEATLESSDAALGDFFGQSGAIDGDWAVVGAPGGFEKTNLNGKVYVFHHEGDGVWTEHAILTASDGDSGDRLGISVAIDGTRIIAGADLASIDGTPGVGAAYVFELQDDEWVETAKLHATKFLQLDRFGSAVAIENDLILVGAFAGGIGEIGRAYVFRLIDGQWVEEQEFEPPVHSGFDLFGEFVEIDDGRLFVAWPGAPGGGAVMMYEETGEAWTLTAQGGSGLSNLGGGMKAFAVDGDTVAGAVTPFGTFKYVLLMAFGGEDCNRNGQLDLCDIGQGDAADLDNDTVPDECRPCPADCDESGALNVLDFVCFQHEFATGDGAADCNGDASLNILDFVCFQAQFSNCR